MVMKKSVKRLAVVILCLLMVLIQFSVGCISASAAGGRLLGDVNNDSAVNLLDAYLIQRHVIGLTDFTPEQKKYADVDKNGSVNLVDASRVMRYSLGLLDSIVQDVETDSKKEEYVNEVLRLINVERSEVGLNPLVLDEAVCQAADIRAKEIEEQFSHTRPNNTPWHTILAEENISYRSSGENIAAGYSTPQEVVNAWMNSDGHRANILSEKYTKIGIGYYYDKDSTYRHYWQQLFIG